MGRYSVTFAVSALAVAGLVAGCGSSPGGPAAPSATTSTATPAVAPANPSTSAAVPPVAALGTLTVVGSGSVTTRPDTAFIDVGAAVSRGSVAAAMSAVGDDTTKLVNALLAGGVARDDITTSSINVGPHYTGSAPDGFSASTMLRVRVRDVSRTSSLLGKAAAAAGNDFQSGGANFSREDTAALAAPARDAAMKDAREHAEAWAKLAGRRLGAIRSVSEVVSASPGSPAQGASGQGGAGIPVLSGTATYTLQVTVVFDLD